MLDELKSPPSYVNASGCVSVNENPRDWHVKLLTAPLAYRTSARMSTGVTPYSLVYGTEAVLPIERECSSLWLAVASNIDPH